MTEFDYTIHHTGSSGNCATIKVGGVTFLIDIGKPYKTISKYLDGVDFLLCTHIHGDHLNLAAYKGIVQNYSHIQIISNLEVGQTLALKGVSRAPDFYVEADDQMYIGEVKVHVFDNVHGVQTNGYIFEYKNQRLLFATDLASTVWYREWLDKHKVKLDVILLEANYNPEVFQFYEDFSKDKDINLWNSGTFRHLPTTEYEDFVNTYLNTGGHTEQLHTSKTFHDFDGLIKKLKGFISQEDVTKWRQQN